MSESMSERAAMHGDVMAGFDDADAIIARWNDRLGELAGMRAELPSRSEALSEPSAVAELCVSASLAMDYSRLSIAELYHALMASDLAESERAEIRAELAGRRAGWHGESASAGDVLARLGAVWNAKLGRWIDERSGRMLAGQRWLSELAELASAELMASDARSALMASAMPEMPALAMLALCVLAMIGFGFAASIDGAAMHVAIGDSMAGISGFGLAGILALIAGQLGIEAKRAWLGEYSRAGR